MITAINRHLIADSESKVFNFYNLVMQLRENFSLKQFNTFGIDVSTQYFLTAQSIDDIIEIFHSFNNRHTVYNTMILGGGSNILLTKYFAGLVIKNEILGIEKINEDDEHVYIKAGAGENWHRFVLYCLENNFAGVENLALIPGNVGASPMQNIGAYGVEIKDGFHSLEAFDMKEKITRKFNKDECEFGYRESIFKRKFKGRFIITSVIYKLNKQPVLNISYGAIKQELDIMKVEMLTIQSIAEAVTRIRRSKLPDPAIIGNAGSFFKNPEIEHERFFELQGLFPGIIGYKSTSAKIKLAAGWMIEQCGWKGYRKGDAGCHAQQALVLVNYGKASGKEIYDLSSDILESVKDKFGVILEREVNII